MTRPRGSGKGSTGGRASRSSAASQSPLPTASILDTGRERWVKTKTPCFGRLERLAKRRGKSRPLGRVRELSFPPSLERLGQGRQSLHPSRTQPFPGDAPVPCPGFPGSLGLSGFFHPCPVPNCWRPNTKARRHLLGQINGERPRRRVLGHRSEKQLCRRNSRSLLSGAGYTAARGLSAAKRASNFPLTCRGL